ncbi:bifunctional diaminohydroxyphosphoribosylaminopyrimidine deaminase/5-amino-6-(5-phosphoribosylamino)uracil reductase RibD [Polymorphum gilvum]|uniref:Riboflavin biosynthesis protein RibD n=1 Tax=Polymorphum gilvum (strain LMG 25793 / CGMCC 1.9160 / SL003B-26A1) TaxID=991905 RepID=F2IWL9_POLGS|nr:bifunctional diaminohydroxyphosphoribosylaminopyrimidine deaminase/5-amino-6-(5-phosphoribosylamino)uracil reductase RibD [Polymorphum gilvum]ADZ70344.1 Bifunctional: diaminohydroxyphosphoribosylaminopyrimidine deaminase (N-terminal); 5-amino-6-(5-phosphoribosylamino) uracil reductase [Polymorphum gilvum SL003B-26A1]
MTGAGSAEASGAAVAGVVCDIDRRYMAAAVALARRGLGRVWPNPSVGALIVADTGGAPVVVGRGVTSPPGGPHAEVNALRQAGDRARGATCYVTLEPCSHHGRTPPCSAALVSAGVRRVVIGIADPNRRVSGRGIGMLRDAGIAVTVGVEAVACRDLHLGHSLRVLAQRPAVTLKLALSADGFIGRLGAGQIAITGSLSKRFAHGIRARSDGILVGVGTVLADDPQLTCRLPGLEGRSPVRVVLDPNARLPLGSRLVRSAAEVPVWAVVANAADPDRLGALARAGVLIIRVPAGPEGIDPLVALTALSARGITRVMVEGGSRVAAAFLRADMVDEAWLVHGPASLGAGGVLPFGAEGADALAGTGRFHVVETGIWGEDHYVRYRRKEA